MAVRFCGLVVIVLTAIPLSAQTAPLPLTVEDAVAAALAHSPEAVAAEAEVARTRALASSAGAWPGPRLQAAPLWSDERQFDLDVVLSQTLYDPGLAPAARAAREALTAAALDLDATRLAVATEARAAWFRLAAAEQRVAVADQDVALAATLVAAAAKARDLGERPGIDVLRAELELGLTEQRRGAEAATVDQARARLNLLIGTAAAAPLTLAARPESVPDIERDGLVEQARQRPSLRRAAARVAQLQAAVDIARSERSPTVAAEGFREDQEHGLRITVELPLFETGRIRGEVRAAKSAVVVAEAELAAAARAVTLAVEQALLAAEAAIGQRAQFRTAVIARAERLVELTTLGYQAGELNLLDVLDARRRLAESRMEAAALDEAVIAALLELERAVGRPLPERRPDVAVLGPPVPAAVLTPTKMAGGVR